MLSKKLIHCYRTSDGERSKSNPSLLELLLSEQGAKTVLETVLRSPIESIVSEEIVFKNLTPDRRRTSARTMVL